MGAPEGNTNNFRHGRRAKRTGSVICHLARHFRAIEADLHLMRRKLTVEARQAHNVEGDLPGHLDSSIGLAVDSERVRRKAQWLAREADDDGDHSRALELELTGHKMASERDAAIARLRLDSVAEADVWATLDSTPAPTPDVIEGHSREPESIPDNVTETPDNG